ncbi:hypothetical protein NYQ10_05075 [Flavobacterium johnsoniae]|uniref:hypothetical protein n=1 Tax=Flavobacterium johnsoniae TaxID=986 RepID=UPI0025AED139|nr:hypothetical protein [Flavobacterium johnsoniae]WJS95828.1 hypothetical protein NYQ10_05075 [Flavobacterium johnsoniae]
MKPIEQNKFSSTISGIKLFLDDIELILSKFSALNENYILFDDDNIYENLEELKHYKGNNPKIIKIELKNEVGSFNFLYVRIVEDLGSVSSYGEKQNKIAYEIEKIFLKRKNSPLIRYFFNPKNAVYNIITITTISCLIYCYKTYYLKEIVNIKQNLWPIVLWFVILFFTLLNKNSNGKIELKRRHESSFLKNNKDSILLVIITAIFTAIITSIITALLS